MSPLKIVVPMCGVVGCTRDDRKWHLSPQSHQLKIRNKLRVTRSKHRKKTVHKILVGCHEDYNFTSQCFHLLANCLLSLANVFISFTSSKRGWFWGWKSVLKELTWFSFWNTYTYIWILLQLWLLFQRGK